MRDIDQVDGDRVVVMQPHEMVVMVVIFGHCCVSVLIVGVTPIGGHNWCGN